MTGKGVWLTHAEVWEGMCLSVYDRDGCGVEKGVFTHHTGGGVQGEVCSTVGTDGHLKGRCDISIGQGRQATPTVGAELVGGVLGTRVFTIHTPRDVYKWMNITGP